MAVLDYNEGDLIILTEPGVNNCFSIFTQSDLNSIKKETIKKKKKKKNYRKDLLKVFYCEIETRSIAI